jgi:hypothetical protein
MIGCTPPHLPRPRKFQRREHVVRIGHRHSGHTCRGTQAGQFLDPHSAFQQGIFGVHTQMDESGGIAHALKASPSPPPESDERRSTFAAACHDNESALFCREPTGSALLYAASRQRMTGQKNGKAAGFITWISPFV